jgi:hypothetical protein
VPGLLTWGVLALPPVVELLEAHLVTHAALQLPLLAASGACIGTAFRGAAGLRGWNERGAAGLLLACFAALVWMLPRSMDAALADPRVDALKLASVPLLVGVPLGASWGRLGPVARAFVIANGVSMLLALAWLYHAAPVRVCNYYLRGEQLDLADAYLAAAVLVTAVCVAPLLFGNPLYGVARFLGTLRSRRGQLEREAAAYLAEGLARNLD